MKITEHKSLLAKLLAKENITIHHGNMRTAYFDVKNRVLGLPTWKDRGADVVDMLIGHEVGHALYTPTDAVEVYNEACNNAPFDVCNVVEDIRIERLIKAAYPGLPRLFKSAYSELVESDFFSIEGKNVAELSFIDRLNLRGKIGDLVDIELNEEEEAIFAKCLAAETFEDVIAICKEIVDRKDEKKQEPKSSEETEESEEESDSAGDDNTTEEDEGEEENDKGSESDDGEEAEEADEKDDSESDSSASSDDVKSEDDSEAESTKATGDAGDEEPEEESLISETQRAFDENLEEDTIGDLSVTPVMMPRKEYVYQQIVDYATLKASRPSLNDGFAAIDKRLQRESTIANEFEEWLAPHKKLTSKKVGTLVREFERRKAAYQYSRAQTSRTGVVDTNKLHSYKIAEDIFLSKTALADAKSHGMVFLIDYSGSMNGVLADVLEQTLNLVEFCKKVGIPFEVYSFTDAWFNRRIKEARKNAIRPTQYEVNLDEVMVIRHLSSDMKKADYEESVKYLWAKIWVRKNYPWAEREIYSKYEELSGTPLNSVLTMMHCVVKDFIAKHRVQKTHFVALTDGDSGKTLVNLNGPYSHKGSFKANNKTYTTSLAGYGTENMLKMISDIPTVSTIGFFIPDAYSTKKAISWKMNVRYGENLTKLYKQWKNDGFLAKSKCQGYDEFFILSSDMQVNDDDFEFDSASDIATSRSAQNKLAKAFSKHHTSSKKSRVLMTKIAEKVA